MPQLIPERRAVELIREHGRRLARMHTVHGIRWYIVPGGEVSSETARRIRNMPNVVGSRDGLFPGLDQTWKITGGRS